MKAALGQSRQILELLSNTLGLVPLIGENLKAAAELTSLICEDIQVRDDFLLILGLLMSDFYFEDYPGEPRWF
jgi:hypothetical protein